MKVTGNATFELAIARIRNPVTGDEEELYLDKPTGFTSKHTELGMSTVGTFASPGMSSDIGGKYAEGVVEGLGERGARGRAGLRGRLG